MIQELYTFFNGIEYVTYPMLRGMEIVRTQTTTGDRYSYRIHTFKDALYFFVDDRYTELLTPALGGVLLLYIRVDDIQRNGHFYYFAPLGWVMLLGRMLWRVWMLPARFFYLRGMLDIAPGAMVPILWFFRLRVRHGSRSGG